MTNLLDLAEPAYEPCRQLPENPVRQKKIDVLLLGDSRDEGAKCHDKVAVSHLRDAAETFLSTR